MTTKRKWRVKKVGKGWRIGHVYFALDDSFSTWEKAYAEAVKRTRTVGVELPAVVGNKCIDPDMSPAMFVEKTPTAYGIFLGHRHMVGVAPSELKPLGEYLLSLHYHRERNKK